MSEQISGKVIIVDDDAGGRQAMTRALQRHGCEVFPFADGLDALVFLREHPDVLLIVTDLRMPGIDGLEVLRRAREVVPDVGVLMITAHGSVETAVGAMKRGAEDYLEKPVNLEVLRARVGNLAEKVRLGREVRDYKGVEAIIHEQGSFEGMIGRSPSMMELFRSIQQVAQARSSVLILGESGSGKELVASAIHRRSLRSSKTYLPLDCASIPAEILESELFGHERGSFTGAQGRKLGKFELANGGTLFLDEIGELPLALQAKLLRALESQTFMRVGGTEEVKVDVRVVAATNRSLDEMAEAGEFRRDLYYRLAVVTLRIPPLRERRDDIPLIATALLERFARENGRQAPVLNSDTLQVLKWAPWPGNVRELRNAMESLAILHQGAEVSAADLPEELRQASRDAELTPAAGASFYGKTMEEIEREVILRTLEQTGGNRTQSAELLGIGLRTLQRKIKQYRDEGYPVVGNDLYDGSA